MGWWDDFKDDVLGIDPNGGGIFDPNTGLIGSNVEGGSFADDVLGIDPSGGGIFDPNTGLLGNWGRRSDGSNLFDDIDPTAPGKTTVEDYGPYTDATMDEAARLYNAGAPELNPLLEEYYNNAGSQLLDQLQGTDEYTQNLATQSATAAGSPFAGAGTFGGARHSYAANEAAQDAILERQRQARQDLGQIGNEYLNWQTGRDWDWLNNFSNLTQPNKRETIDYPSGADILTSQLGLDLIRNNYTGATGSAPPGGSGGSGGGGGGKWYDPIKDAAIKKGTDWAIGEISDWFNLAEGGEVPHAMKREPDWF